MRGSSGAGGDRFAWGVLKIVVVVREGAEGRGQIGPVRSINLKLYKKDKAFIILI